MAKRQQRGNQKAQIEERQTIQWPKDSKGAIRRRKSKKDRQYNGQKIAKGQSEDVNQKGQSEGVHPKEQSEGVNQKGQAEGVNQKGQAEGVNRRKTDSYNDQKKKGSTKHYIEN